MKDKNKKNMMTNSKAQIISFKELINVIKDNLALLYVILAILSITIEANYYKKYNINIFSYLDLTEYLIHFFKGFYELIISILITYISCHVTFYTIELIRFATKLYSISIVKINIICFIISTVTSFVILYNLNVNFYSWLGVIIGLIIWFLYHSSKKKNSNEVGFIKNDILYLVIYFSFTALIISHFDKKSMLESSQGITIICPSNKTIQLGGNLKLIGETNNYIFIYDISNKKTRIIMRDKINEIIYN